MTKDELKIRTKEYGIEMIRFLYSLPKESITSAIINQLARSATSIGANYKTGQNLNS